MNTECYCVHCPKHPLFEDRGTIEFPVGWYVGKSMSENERKSGRFVNCLKPCSAAFDTFSLSANDFYYQTTAYGDGLAITGLIEEGIELYAWCENESYVE